MTEALQSSNLSDELYTSVLMHLLAAHQTPSLLSATVVPPHSSSSPRAHSHIGGMVIISQILPRVVYVCVLAKGTGLFSSLSGRIICPSCSSMVCVSLIPINFFLIFQPIKQRWALGFFDFPFILSEKWKSLCLKGRSLLFALLDCVCRKRWLA